MSTKIRRKTHKYREYNAFIEQTEIVSIRAISAKIDDIAYSESPVDTTVKYREKVSYENNDNEFNAFHRYNVTIADRETGDAKVKLSVTFCVTYSSKIPMNNDIFNVFKERNLPLNTWPYFREFIHNSLARFGWPDIIAPLHKV
ncbi:hypothetical protein ACFLTK_02945 [Chloroflexota bacterium]